MPRTHPANLLLSTILLLTVTVLPASAQPMRLWEHALRGPSSETAFAAVALPGGPMLLAGEVNNSLPNLLDVHIARVGANGDSAWAYDIAVPLTQHANAAANHPQGMVVAGSELFEFGGEYYSNALLQAFDVNGAELWRRTYPGYHIAEALCVIRTADGGYLIGGYLGDANQPTDDRDAYLIKTAADGTHQWSNTWDFGNRDEITALLEVPGAGYIAAVQATVSNPTNVQIGLLAVNPFGAELTRRIYGSDASEYVYAMHRRADGGLDLVGETWVEDEPSQYTDGFLHRLAPDGTLQEQHHYGGTGYDGFRDMIRLPDGSTLLGGHAMSYSGNGSDDMWVVKLDAAANVLWQASYGGEWDDKGYTLLQLDRPGEPQYVIAGHTRSWSHSAQWDPYVVRFADRPAPASLVLAPDDDEIVIPDSGGTFDFVAILTSHLPDDQAYQAWINVSTPATDLIGPLSVTPLNLPGGWAVSFPLSQEVPDFAAGGEYYYIAHLGQWPFFTVAIDTIHFTVDAPDTTDEHPPPGRDEGLDRPHWPALQRGR